jgi:hypothetical protein
MRGQDQRFDAVWRAAPVGVDIGAYLDDALRASARVYVDAIPMKATRITATEAAWFLAADVNYTATRVEAEHPDGYSWRETDDELEVRVPAAFRELEILDVPSCRPEPAQIVNALNRIRDAELLAFIEMGTAEAGGSSRETALRELDIQMPIVERELKQVDALLGAIE